MLTPDTNSESRSRRLLNPFGTGSEEPGPARPVVAAPGANAAGERAQDADQPVAGDPAGVKDHVREHEAARRLIRLTHTAAVAAAKASISAVTAYRIEGFETALAAEGLASMPPSRSTRRPFRRRDRAAAEGGARRPASRDLRGDAVASPRDRSPLQKPRRPS